MTLPEFDLLRSPLLHTRAALLVIAPMLFSAGCVTEPEPSLQETDGDASDASDDVEIDFAPERAPGLIVDENGQTIGYVDAKLRQRDLEGNLTTAAAAAPSFSDKMVRVTLWDKSYFAGAAISYTSYGRGFSVNLNNVMNNRLSSVVASPGCKVELYDGLDQTGTLLTTVNPNQGAATYVSLPSGQNDKASSMRVTCAHDEDTLCGLLYKGTNYSGDVFPVYNQRRYQLTNYPGWNDTVSSVAFNPYGTCDGIGLWQHYDVFSWNIDTRQRRLFLRHKSNNPNLHTKGMGDEVTTVETDRELSSREAHNAALGRALQEMQTRRSWGKAFVCNTMQQLCVDHKSAITGMTTLTGIYTCGKLLGSGVITALFTAAVSIASGGSAAVAVAPLDALAAGQVVKGVGCLAAVGVAVIVEESACSATMETYCNAQAR